MKHLLAALCGLISVTAAQACDWDRQDCSDEILGQAKPKLEWLKQNPDFMQKHWNEVQRKANNTDINSKTCNSRRACNQVYGDFAGLITLYYMEYKNKPTVVAPAPVQDKWAGQCVIVAKTGATAYVDQSATNKAAGLNENLAYTVTQTNGGKYVGLATVPDYSKPNPDAGAGKFVGWVKKSDLQMQDLRNCN